MKKALIAGICVITFLQAFSKGKVPKKAYLAPERKSLAFNIVDGYINMTIPVNKGYFLLVFE
jgi:hypothetical protein